MEKPQRGHGASVRREAHRTLYAEALAIKREYATDLRQPEVARRIGASERALQRAFAEHSDLSFSQQLSATKLNVAGRLLRRDRAANRRDSAPRWLQQPRLV